MNQPCEKTKTVEHKGYSKIMIHSCGGNNEVPVGSRTKDKLDKVLCMENFEQCESAKQLRLLHNRIMHLSGLAQKLANRRNGREPADVCLNSTDNRGLLRTEEVSAMHLKQKEFCVSDSREKVDLLW
eukprot:TRINITY_DN277_c0_g2_i7.p2 TRINITY_DN277_c0_g2~~TRINITY_DN277_c0_g2_i7.p2  ORF type:complete len:127 (+),score=14.16 TRINITY_DN277_c0_g2_i7:401-781(+)